MGIPSQNELPRLNTGSRRQTGFPDVQAKLNCYPQSSIPVGLHDYCCKMLCVFPRENVDTVFCALSQKGVLASSLPQSFCLSIIYKKQKQQERIKPGLAIHPRLIRLVRRGILPLLS
jgi:hypothetical protein